MASASPGLDPKLVAMHMFSACMYSMWCVVDAHLDDPGASQVPLPILCQLLCSGNPVVRHKGPALAAQVDCPEEEVLLVLVHLP